MMHFLILISLLVPVLKAQENPRIIYAQVGGIVVLPRDKIQAESVYVNWYQGTESHLTISRNPQSGIQKGKNFMPHFSLTEDFSLRISPVQESDFVVWKCEQHVLTQTYIKTYRLYRVDIPKVPAVMVGGSLFLKCLKETSSVNPTVTWTSPCHQKIYTTDIISVNDVSVCHSGVWTCELQHEKLITTATTTVFVIDLAPSPFDPIYTSVYPHTKVCVPCSLYSEIPWSVLNESGLETGSWSFTPLTEKKQQSSPLLRLTTGSVVKWNKAPGANITAMENPITNRNLSIFLPVSEKIRGVYNCELKFKSKTLSREVKVEVLQIYSSGDSSVFEGQRVNLTCTLGHTDTSDLKIKWICVSCSPSFSSHPSVFSIPKVKMQDKGFVKCELWKNGKMLTSAQRYLNVVKAPVDIWLCVAISSGIVVFILLIVITIICIRRHKQMMMYRRRKTRFCCCNNKQPKGFYKT